MKRLLTSLGTLTVYEIGECLFTLGWVLLILLCAVAILDEFCHLCSSAVLSVLDFTAWCAVALILLGMVLCAVRALAPRCGLRS